MPWICRSDANGFNGGEDDLSVEEWKKLDRIVQGHQANVTDEDDTGLRIDVMSEDQMMALEQELSRQGFTWVNGDWRESV